MSARGPERRAGFRLALPVVGLLLAACAPAVATDVPVSPISPASVPSGGTGKCDPVEFAAAIGVPTPAPEGVSLSPNIAKINDMVKNCDPSITDPQKAVYRRVMPLIARDLQATPAPARPEQRVIPEAGGGFTPDLPVPSATPRPPEISPTIAITLPDGTKATATLPPFTATLVPATATPDQIVRVENKPEKSPLPRYGAFMGDLLNAKTMTRDGLLVLAFIPEKDGGKIFFYFIRQYSPDRKGWDAGIVPMVNFQDRTFQLSIAPTGIGGRPKKIQVVVKENATFLSGSLFEGVGGIISDEWTGNFNLPFAGSGKEAVINAVKQAKRSGYGLGPGEVIINEVKNKVDFTQWPD